MIKPITDKRAIAVLKKEIKGHLQDLADAVDARDKAEKERDELKVENERFWKEIRQLRKERGYEG